MGGNWTYSPTWVGLIGNWPSSSARSSRFLRQLGTAAGATGSKLPRGMHDEKAMDVQVEVIVKVAALVRKLCRVLPSKNRLLIWSWIGINAGRCCPMFLFLDWTYPLDSYWLPGDFGSIWSSWNINDGLYNWNQNLISHQFYVGAEEDGIDSRIAMDSFADVRKVIAISSWIKLRHPRAEHQYLLTVLLMADGNANGQEDDELHSKFSQIKLNVVLKSWFHINFSWIYLGDISLRLDDACSWA